MLILWYFAVFNAHIKLHFRPEWNSVKQCCSAVNHFIKKTAHVPTRSSFQASSVLIIVLQQQRTETDENDS